MVLLWVCAASFAAAQVARIVLRWKDVPGASAYEVQIAKDPAFVEVVLQTRTTTAGYRWEQLPTTTHWWRVRSFDSESRASEWSAPRTLAVDTAIPAPLKPPDGASVPCGASVALELDASPLVKEYLVELSSSADFSAHRALRSSTPNFDVPGLSAGTWHWRTRAVDIKGRTTDAGPARSFSVKVSPPKAKAVADVMQGTPQVLLTWAEAGCAASYLVEAVHDGKERVAIPASGTSLAFKSGSAGEYRWRVASVDERGTAGEYGPESVFKVKLPAPGSRMETVAIRTELSWAAVPTAVSYKLELFRGTESLASPNVQGTSWKSGELSPGEYKWRVTAKDGQGHTSAPSEFRTFTRSGGVALAVPAWVSPQGDSLVSIGAEVELSWSSPSEAISYEVELDGAVQAVTSAVYRTPALAEGAHTVRVRALGAGYRFSDWVGPLELFAGRPAVTHARVSLVGEQVEVTLLDAKERIVRGAEPRFSVKDGSIEPARELEGVWQLTWNPPAGGDDTLHVEEREFRFEHPLTVSLDPFVSIAARGGGIFNAGAIASPSFGIGVTVRMPFLRRRPCFELRVGWAGATASTDLGGVTLKATANLMPLTFLLAWHHNVGPFQLKAGAGPSAVPLWVSVGSTSNFTALPGVEIVASLSRHLGPGRLEGEISFLYSRLETTLARLNSGGLAVRVGYAFDL